MQNLTGDYYYENYEEVTFWHGAFASVLHIFLPEGETLDFVVTVTTNEPIEFSMYDEFTNLHPLIFDGIGEDGSKSYRYKGTAFNCR